MTHGADLFGLSLFGLSVPVLLAILAMGAASYGTRVLGIVLVRSLKPSPFLDAWLHHVPGAMFMALVAAAAVKGGMVDTLALIGAAAAMYATRTLVAAIAAAVAIAALLPLVLG